MLEIPPILIESIKNKNVVLFLGSGFAYNAIHPSGSNPPLGNQLGELLDTKFLGGSFKGSSLMYISDLAISESNLFAVQNYIHEIFDPFKPNNNHKIYPTLPWKAIFTTNYDLILERAYENNPDAVQNLSKVYRNTPEQQVFKTPNSVPYYKLHGCISYINDEQLPLILTTEQYITHKLNRDRLFKMLSELALDYTILFIGYSNQDQNIRAILKELESLKEGRPRSYMVGPNISQTEIRYWENRRITPIQMGHEEFIIKVDELITKNERTLASLREVGDHNIYSKFAINPKELIPTDSLLNFLNYETEFVHRAIPIGITTPQNFYKGFFNNWDPIIKNLDIRRNLENRILNDILLDDAYQSESKSFFFLIKGFAGSGKTVLLKRLAWEAANVFDKICLYLKPNSPIRIDPIIELSNYVKDRIYLFIDNAIENQSAIIQLLTKVRKEQCPITIISTEKINSLNEDENLQNYITEDYKLTYLELNEIDALLDKLEIHKSLGYLEEKSKTERRKELEKRAGRVLLIALYEATGGKPFEEIIFDEYNGINTISAKSLYLTVSVFHRLGTKIRAGLISRIHDIGFDDFKNKLFKPLEFIVFNERDYFINDFVYFTRHQFIAQIIFEQVLSGEQERYDEYIRILKNLNIDYNSDWFAFLDITNARKLNEIFKDPVRIRNIYDLAESISPTDAKLIQQRGIFELLIDNLFSAQKLLKKANSMAPDDPSISHSLAEVSLRKAEATSNNIERVQYLFDAETLCKKIIKKKDDHSYGFHTLLKISLLRLTDLIKGQTIDGIEAQLKTFEKILNEARQSFSNEEFLLDIESKFNQIVDNEPKAIDLLRKAFEINKASPYLAIRYAKMLVKNTQLNDAINALKETLELNPNDRDVNYFYASMLRMRDPKNHEDCIHYYRRSFTKGDSRHEAQFWYARALYLTGEISKSKDIFNELSGARISPRAKSIPRGVVNSDENVIEERGTIIRQESTYAFIKREKYGDDIFLYRDTKIEDWHNYKVGSKLHFNLAFNYKGPIAINVKII